MPLPETILAAGCRALGWTPSDGQIGCLLAYLRGVLEAGRRVNLLGPTSFEEAIARHLVDSAAAGLHLREAGTRAEGVLLDLGSGAGFTGVPLAVLLPEWTVHLVEGRGRKIAEVARIAGELGVANVRTHHARLSELLQGEEGRTLTGSCDLVVARAVAPLGELVREAAGALRPGGTLLCWKAVRVDDSERAEGLRRARARGLASLPDLSYRSDHPRILVRYRTTSEGAER